MISLQLWSLQESDNESLPFNELIHRLIHTNRGRRRRAVGGSDAISNGLGGERA